VSGELKDLIECWTLDEAEFELLANKTGATRLGFALLLQFFELEARFPRREDVPRAAPACPSTIKERCRTGPGQGGGLKNSR
jgi:hypothetical protein